LTIAGLPRLLGGHIEAVRFGEILCRRENLKGGSLMKRLIATLFVVLFIFSLSLSAQANSGLAALEGKLSAFMTSQGEISDKFRSSPPVERLPPVNYGVVIGYYTSVSGEWWTGLAITNASSNTNYITVGCFDASGNAVAGGSLTLGANALQAALIATFMQTGKVPQKGSIAVFGTEPFIVDRYLGDLIGGGFGEVHLEAKVY
jgi:hypothetical protein